MKLVVLGLSLSSSWGNGHATTFRSLLKAFARRGHAVTFLERDVPWYSGAHRDLAAPDFCELVFYRSVDELAAHAETIATADAVLVGSYVPDGIRAVRFVQHTARGALAFYDIDTPVTLAALEAGTCAYLDTDQIPGFQVYFSFTGGPTLETLQVQFGAQAAQALYCCVDPDIYRPREGAKRWDLSYLGTYSPDRQPALERLLLDPARRAPHLRFAVAGPQYPDTIAWPPNVDRFEHVGPQDHPEFYSLSRFTLNVTRVDMVRAGFSPSVRLFEAGACGVPIISDVWPGIETVLTPGESVILAETADGVLACLSDVPEAERERIGASARSQVLAGHTAARRALELEAGLRDALDRSARH